MSKRSALLTRSLVNSANQRRESTLHLLPLGIQEELIELYRDDIQNLCDLVNMDFSHRLKPWPRPAAPSGGATARRP
jgi:hypothetical protein